LVSDLTSDVSEVKTLGQAQAFAEEVQRRFSKTGVYKSVVVKEEVSKSGKGSDCVIELDEANVNFQQGFSRSSTGAVGSTTMMSLYNQLGWGERWSVNVGAAVGSDALVSRYLFASNTSSRGHDELWCSSLAFYFASLLDSCSTVRGAWLFVHAKGTERKGDDHT
jgi:hypothetical protein